MPSTPPLQLDVARDIATALGRDLLAQDLEIPNLDQWTATAGRTPGRLWLGTVADGLGALSFARLQPLTARRVVASLADDLHGRQVPEEIVEAHISAELEASVQDLTPQEWLAAAGDAWEDALSTDARSDAEDDWDTARSPLRR